jgi:prophage maintenance system killer protein
VIFFTSPPNTSRESRSSPLHGHHERYHPFIDGNKRTALGACLVFLRLNGIEPRPDGPEWESLTQAVAASLIDRDQTIVRLRDLLLT